MVLTYPYVVLNLYEFLSSVDHKRWYFEECWYPDSSNLLFFSDYRNIILQKYLHLCSAEERNS